MKNKKLKAISQEITNVKMKKLQKEGLVFITGGLLAYHCSQCTCSWCRPDLHVDPNCWSFS
ncbi:MULTISPECIES: hypothetical protein [unclassified Chryseobacterium]|uniref:hypothetical protein n=1 Tax=unclassified Chryseobacterium TaxID=2593645 RepID=UPI000D9C1035|nr:MULTISPECIES: hypothetical protein [unclassified Chryseobacterium]PWW27199.1 hypothetical protein DEU40_107145 [Chryseobacterium sp. AG844]